MTDPPRPADHEVRERIIHDLDTSFFLEAGAGSGKTSVLVARVVNLVRQGRALPEIVAITFTEKAAAELRERIRAELAAAGLVSALRDVDAAPIQTIHAFAANLLRERALEAGLDPDFRVLDQLQADLRFAQSWRSWLWSSQPPQADLARALDLGLQLRDLRAAAEQLARHRDLTADYVHSESSEPLEASTDDAPEQRERDRVLAALTVGLRELIEADAAQRRRAGLLSYDDLLLETRDLLARSAEARRGLRARYRTILIDEFQDTDPLQAQIALLLAAEPDTDDWTQARPGPGRLVLAGDPKQSIYRFRRADIDIYEQVRDRFAASPETAALATLSVNFRARPQLIDWQNRILRAALQPDPHYPRAQARWEPTVPYRTDAEVGVAVIPSRRQFRRAGEAREGEAALIANLITALREADAPLGALPEGEETRRPQYRDIAVLLRTRTGAELYTAALDRAGVPYHFDSGQGFYQQPEIRAVARLLQVLDDPTDEAAVLAVLKSPLAAASDAELYQLRAALDGRPLTLDAEPLPEAYTGRLREPLAALAALRRALPRFRLPELVDHVIRDSGLLPAQAVGASPAQMRQRQANLRMLVQRAAHFADNDEDSLRPFVRWLTQRGVRNLPESESPTTEADDDAVRILTIHQAKGLEFPIVILPKLQDQPGGGVECIVDRPNDRVEFQIGDGRDHPYFRTSGYLSAQRRDRVYADAEARRMLYVAATRARDWLILPSFPADSIRQRVSFHTYLDDADPHWLTDRANRDTAVVAPHRFDAAPAPRPVLRLPPLDELRQAWRARHADALAGGLRQITPRTPSSLHPWTPAADDEPNQSNESDEPNESDSVALSPLDFGSAVHEALEAADFARSEITLQRARRICRARQLPPEPVLEHVERALQSELLQRAARAAVVHRELPLTTIATADGATTITEGVADLLFAEQDRWILVDYKSDTTLPAERREHYNQQIQAYTAMLAASDIHVAEAYMLLTATGESLRVPLADAPAS